MITLHKGKHYILNNERIVSADGAEKTAAEQALWADSTALPPEEGSRR